MPYPGELGQTLPELVLFSLACCRMRPDARDTGATGSELQTAGRRASWLEGVKVGSPGSRVLTGTQSSCFPASTKEPEH